MEQIEIDKKTAAELEEKLQAIEKLRDALYFANASFEAKRVTICNKLKVSPRFFMPMRKPDGDWILAKVPRED